MGEASLQRATERLRAIALSTSLLLFAGWCASACEGNQCSSADRWSGCVLTEPSVNAADDACCDGRGWCLASDLLSASQAAQLSHDSCVDPEKWCVPKELSAPGVAPETCRSVGNAEGRCLSDCLPLMASRTLPQSTCPTATHCAPCYDPVSGAATGACSLTSHDAPSEPAVLLAACCRGQGLCVPSEALTPLQQGNAAQDSCTDESTLCVPRSVALNPGAPASPCHSIAHLDGGCLSTCIPAVAAQTDLLPQDTCGEDERCVPCIDPRTAQPTGAC